MVTILATIVTIAVNVQSVRIIKESAGKSMLSKSIGRIRVCLSVVAIAFLLLAGSQFIATANPSLGIYDLYVDQFDCSNFHFKAYGNPGSGYAAVRIWLNNQSNTYLVDSFTSGYPSFYTPIYSISGPIVGFTNEATVSFPAQPAGTSLTARVYRAPNALPGSWDGQSYRDKTITCTYGIHALYASQWACSSFYFNGQGSPGSGYAAVRIWVGKVFGTPLVDSYTSGYPSFYMPIPLNGDFNGTVSFPAQPPGTILVARVYRALSAVPGSWDGGDIADTSPIPCTLPGTPTAHP